MTNFWGVILNSVGYLCLNATTIVFIHCFYDAAFLWNKKKALMFLLGAVIQTIITFVFPDYYSLINWLFLVPYCFVATYDYTGKKSTGIWRFAKFLLFIQTLMIIYGLVATICISQESFESFFAFFNTPNMPTTNLAISVTDKLIVDILCIVFYGTIFFLLYSVYKKGVVMRCGKREVWIIIVTSFLSHILLSFIMYGMSVGDDTYLRYALALLGSIFAFLFPVFVYYTRYNEYYRTRTAAQEQHLKAELAHFMQYKQAQEETRRFRHDIHNNLLCMSELLQQRKTEETAAYLNDLLQTSDTLRAKYVTGDEMLDSIVGVKAGVMQQKQIPFQLDGVLAGGLQWKPMDICNVFANALDNAIEANEQLPQEDRLITMRIKSTAQFWFIILENPVQEAVDTTRLFQRHGGFTSKTDSSHHGMGTYNIKHTVEAYGGMVKAECIDRTFRLEIILDKNNSI